ncbi:chromatin assembly factor 1 subunit A-like [Micropterus salmoides]|uniref:chromatin assembly factor 1 subunit A-like n=1 Tax=Micropterus salmoides TaxID=27706 RepID=UPI0018EB42C8|nr:chromatin assembly factor 1 subunit A-like [Micropterus salmoides]
MTDVFKTCNVVRVLRSTDQRDATPSITTVNPSATHTTKDPPTDTQTSATPSTTPCPTCKMASPQNYLVAAGVIPESLANVLMSQALDRKEKVRRRLPLPARVITSDEYVHLLEQKEAEEKEKEEKKRKRKEDMAKKKEEKRQAQKAKAEETGTISN